MSQGLLVCNPNGSRGEASIAFIAWNVMGEEGRGDGPRAAMLAPRPGNLVSAATSVKTDEELLEILAKGVPRTAMNGWSQQLSDDERRHLLAYIRTLVHFQNPPSPQLPFSGS